LRRAEPIPYNRIVRTRRAFKQEFRLNTKEETRVALTCPSCGNDQNFLVKTLQMHVVHMDDSRVEVSEEGRPAVLEVLCDECETSLKFEDMDEGIRKEMLLTLGAR
jgi:RNase P subunit RPR2